LHQAGDFALTERVILHAPTADFAHTEKMIMLAPQCEIFLHQQGLLTPIQEGDFANTK
jgi:hypothetical protein